MSSIFFLCACAAILWTLIQFLQPQGFVENKGFEPLTPCVQGRCSSQLS